MIEAFSDTERQFLTRIIMTKIIPTLEGLARGGQGYAFHEWKNMVEDQKAAEAVVNERIEVQRIMNDSTRCKRDGKDKEILQKYISQLACIPNEISREHMDCLSDEIDYFPCIGKSIIFLQGDFGNVYYIVARGEVDLYLEKSKDREMQLGSEFGSMRGVPYEQTNADLSKLGTKIATLKEGQGFGEFAILSTSGKLRMCAAVAATEETFLFVLHGDTYNTVLRQHHYRSKQLSAATALLQELPIFNTYSYSQLSNIAYGMKSTCHGTQSFVAREGARVESVLIVYKGQVKVLKPQKKLLPKSSDGIYTAAETLEMRLPKLAYAILGTGSIIGEFEIQNNLHTFAMEYMSSAPDTEVFEMPAAIYRDCMVGSSAQSELVAQKLRYTKNREAEYSQRVDRTEDSMKSFAMNYARATDDKAQLLKLLPLLIDGVTLDGGLGVEDASTLPHQGFISTKYRDATSASFMRTGEINGETAPVYGYDPSVSTDDNLAMYKTDIFTYKGLDGRDGKSRSHQWSKKNTPGLRQPPMSASLRRLVSLFWTICICAYHCVFYEYFFTYLCLLMLTYA